MAKFDDDVWQSVYTLGEPCGLDILHHLQANGHPNVSHGGMYLALERLVEGGFVSSRAGEATAERGWRRRTYYRATGSPIPAHVPFLLNLRPSIT